MSLAAVRSNCTERGTPDKPSEFSRQLGHSDRNFPFPESIEADGTPKRAAICIGPEHGTVGALLIKEAAKGIGFDVLIPCWFIDTDYNGES